MKYKFHAGIDTITEINRLKGRLWNIGLLLLEGLRDTEDVHSTAVSV